MTTPLQAHSLSHCGISHGFFTRNGGASDSIYTSLNCGYGSGDVREKVAENRRRVAAYFGRTEAQLLTLYQIHSGLCIPVTAPFDNTPPEADALATATPGIILGILTADCAPVLFVDPKARVIGAAHAGWKGAHGGVLEATAAAMESLGASRERIRAATGPCIAQASYQVGPEFMERFDDKRFFTSLDASGHAYFDLKAYAAHRLREAGISPIETLPHDTCADEAQFFSYRRTTLRKEGVYGRQISCIMLEKQ